MAEEEGGFRSGRFLGRVGGPELPERRGAIIRPPLYHQAFPGGFRRGGAPLEDNGRVWGEAALKPPPAPKGGAPHKCMGSAERSAGYLEAFPDPGDVLTNTAPNWRSSALVQLCLNAPPRWVPWLLLGRFVRGII